MALEGEWYATNMQDLRWNFKNKNLIKLHAVKLDKRVVAYKSCVMDVNNVPFFGILFLFYLTG